MKRAVLLLFLVVLAGLLVLAMVASVAAFAWFQYSGRAIPFGHLVPVWGTSKSTEVIFSDLNLAPGDNLTVSNPVGTISVSGGDQSTITATLTAYGRNREDSRRYLDAIDVNITETPGGVVIDVALPDRTGVRTQIDNVDLVLVVPHNLNIDLDSRMGRVTVKDIDGDLSIRASMGDVRVTNIGGSLDVRASMGSVTVREALIRDRLSLDASMGSITFEGNLGAVNEVTASMGSIALTLPSDTCVDLHANVSMGSFRSAFGIADTAVDERVWQGVMGQGTPDGTLRVRASMGSVNINKR